MIKRSLSIVIPAYNEEAAIGRVLMEYAKIAEKFEKAEIIVVNDASLDRTPKILDEFSKRFPLKIITLKNNSGHGRALRIGLDAAENELVFHADADNQNSPDDFWKLYSEIDDFDVVLGRRLNRSDTASRRVISLSLRYLIRITCGANLKDANIPFKLYKREVLHKILSRLRPDLLVPSIHLNLAALRTGLRVKEVPVAQFPRVSGRSSLSGLKLARFCINAFFEILRNRAALAAILIILLPCCAAAAGQKSLIAKIEKERNLNLAFMKRCLTDPKQIDKFYYPRTKAKFHKYGRLVYPVAEEVFNLYYDKLEYAVIHGGIESLAQIPGTLEKRCPWDEVTLTKTPDRNLILRLAIWMAHPRLFNSKLLIARGLR